MVRRALPHAKLVAGRVHPAAPAIATGALAFSVAWPVLHIAHELIVIAAAALLRGIATFPLLRNALLAAPLDPIYTGAALEMLGRIKTAGIAVATPVGDGLHAVLPALFARSEPVHAGWAEAVIWRGSAVLAQSLAVFAADVAVLVVGIVLVRLALGRRSALPAILATRDRRSSLAVFGLLVQGFVPFRLLASPPTAADIEAAGASFAFGVLFPTLTGRRLAVSDLQAFLPGPLLPLLMLLLAAMASYAAALLLLRVLQLGDRLLGAIGRRTPLAGAWSDQQRRLTVWGTTSTLALALAVGLAVAQPMPAGPQAGGTGDEAALEQPDKVPSAAVPAGSVPTAWAALPTGPSVVEVIFADNRFYYLVNAQTEVIRGMGYNPIYAGLERADRARRYDQDFALMREAGVNTVFGWTYGEFDRLTLDKAKEYGLGVAMPYHLSPALDYSSAEVQAMLTRDVLQWVETYRGHPALRMWSIGNEVLHKIVYPSWLPLKRNSMQSIAQAQAFARFYVGLIDLVHSADPSHPVLLRDAEDAYLSWIREALLQRPAKRTWFIYGTNVYTNRLKDIADGWPQQKVENALLISEFAPGGLGPRDRPEGYRRMWETIRRHPEWTLGGVPYVWTTAGPEEVDRAFGLVDGNGKPVDGALEVIGRAFKTTASPPLPRALRSLGRN